MSLMGPPALHAMRETGSSTVLGLIGLNFGAHYDMSSEGSAILL